MANSGQSHTGFFESMPPWAKGIVFALTTIPVAIAISGMILNVNMGSYLDAYMEIQLNSARLATESAADRIIAEVGDRITSVETRIESVVLETAEQRAELNSAVQAIVAQTGEIGERVTSLEVWACDHADEQQLAVDRPAFCDAGG